MGDGRASRHVERREEEEGKQIDHLATLEVVGLCANEDVAGLARVAVERQEDIGVGARPLDVGCVHRTLVRHLALQREIKHGGGKHVSDKTLKKYIKEWCAMAIVNY